MNLTLFLELFLATEIFSCDRNTPADKTKSPLTYDDMFELYVHLHWQGRFQAKVLGHPALLQIIAAQLEEVAESILHEKAATTRCGCGWHY
jgi:hypothetical protein